MIKKIILVLILGSSCLMGVIFIMGGGYGERDTSHSADELETILFSHRGFSPNFPENTFEAFNENSNAGFTALETDINYTKDSVLILFHDDNAQRLLGINQNVNQLSWNEIKSQKLLHNGNLSESRVVLFSDFLKKLTNYDHIYLDIKNANSWLRDSLIQLIDKNNLYQKVILADGDLFFLASVKYKNPKILTAFEGFNAGKEALYYLIPKNFKPDFYASNIDKVNKNHIRFLSDNNLLHKRIVYGVNSKNSVKIKELGLKNVIIDHDFTRVDYSTLQKHLFEPNQ